MGKLLIHINHKTKWVKVSSRYNNISIHKKLILKFKFNSNRTSSNSQKFKYLNIIKIKNYITKNNLAIKFLKSH